MQRTRHDERLVAVGICDDEAQARASLRALVSELAESLSIPVRIYEFPNSMALLVDTPRLDILFLDIQMPHGNGIDAGRTLRQTNNDLDIVLVTAFEEYAVEGYSIEAKRYLLKPLSKERFFRQIGPGLEEAFAKPDETIALVSEGEVHSVSPRDIAYVCTKPPKLICFHTNRRDIVIRDSLKNWEERLDSHAFFRCHSAFLVNMRFVRVIGKSEVELIGGESIPLSRHRRKALIEAFARYAGGLL